MIIWLVLVPAVDWKSCKDTGSLVLRSRLATCSGLSQCAMIALGWSQHTLALLLSPAHQSCCNVVCAFPFLCLTNGLSWTFISHLGNETLCTRLSIFFMLPWKLWSWLRRPTALPVSFSPWHSAVSHIALMFPPPGGSSTSLSPNPLLYCRSPLKSNPF